MLYLARKIGQSIVINNNIEIKITTIGNNQVKLGINFSKSDIILRKEIYDKIAKENLAATTTKFK